MFHFCVHKLGMSESEAFRRLTAARLAKHFPQLLAAIGEGRIHLSTVVLLRDLFTESNVDELIATVTGMSKREVENLIARRAPKPDVASSIRKMPGTPSPAPVPSDADPAHSDLLSSCSAAPHATDANPHAQTVESDQCVDPGLLPPTLVPKMIPVGAQVAPLSAERHKVQFTASTGLRAKLERAQSLLRHANPDGDLAVVVERAIDLLIAKLERTKLGAAVSNAAHAKAAHTKEASDSAQPLHGASQLEPEMASDLARRPDTTPTQDSTSMTQKRTAVPRSHIRQVILRDGEQCSFVGDDGKRCGAVDFLEVDHKHPRSRGGGNEVSNLRLLCRAHNQYVADRAFGSEFMTRKRQKKKRRSRGRGPGASPLTQGVPA